MTPTLSHHLLTHAYNNAWANHRLLKACMQLTQVEFEAPRTGFFPSIKATLNHILTVDWFYIDALERELEGREPHPNYLSFFAQDQPCANCAAVRAEQRDADRRLIDYCRQMKDEELNRTVTILRLGSVQRDKRHRLLAHLFQHQTHHRGQVHAMLSGTPVAPPQLDEFFSAGEADLRQEDFRELGWTEQMIWG
ncbi:damage-inducible protein DinB [Duganella sp. FT92W]|uniref:Damage-inducible protein DinB n=1 Tax=Pseudoduganella rivuli TaxID=2666085 RepID=A0A7X2LV88_9BURK|nr:DinB family protein [Pseudoduganella rivuli]MRV73817.1 damage-inducible protein DinB [Pseudoduganella rivuli]